MPNFSDRNIGLGRIFAPLNRFIHLKNVSPNHKTNNYSTLFGNGSFVRKIIRNLTTSQKYNLPEKMKLLSFLLIWKLSDIQNLIDLDKVKKTALEIVRSNFHDTIWDEDGSWINDPKETNIRVTNWLYYWEYFLSDEKSDLNQIPISN